MKRTLVCLLSILALVLVCAAPALAAGRQLNLYIWSEYLPDEILARFTKETGIKVTVTTYDSNEAMYAKVRLAKGYDVIVPSTDFVSRMRKEGLLLPLDKTKLTGLANLDPRFLDRPFDPKNTYSLPYMWGTTAIAVNTSLVKPGTVTRMSDLWKPEFKGRLLMPNDMRTLFGIGLKSLGFSINDTNPDHVRKAYEKLTTLVPSVKVFDSDSPKQAMINKEVALGVMWNGEAYVANDEDERIVYVYPQDGFSMWIDNLCIPKGARNLAEAHAFIAFLMKPDVAAAISEELGYATPNKKAMGMLSEETRKNPIIYPDDAAFGRGEFETDLGEAIGMYEKYWTKLKIGE